MSGNQLHQGDRIKFHSKPGTVMRAVVTSDGILGKMVEIHIKNDPFPVMVENRKIERIGASKNMAKAKGPTTKQLRQQAKQAGIPGYLDMDQEELKQALEAIESQEAEEPEEDEEELELELEDEDEDEEEEVEEKPAKKAKAKKGTKAAKKAAAPKAEKKAAKKVVAKKSSKKAEVSEDEDKDPNPFRKGTNLHLIAKELMKGGTRKKLIDKLEPKMDYNPRKNAASFDRRAETDRRLKAVAYILRDNHGFEYETEGRGESATMKVTAPE